MQASTDRAPPRASIPINLTAREAFAIGQHCKVSPTTIEGQPAAALLVAFAPTPLDSEPAPLLPIVGPLGSRVLALSSLPIEIYLRRFARVWLQDPRSVAPACDDPIIAASWYAAGLLQTWKGHPIVLIGEFVRRAFALALEGVGLASEAASVRHMPDRSTIGGRVPLVPSLSWIENTNAASLRTRAQNDVRAILRGAATIDTPPCPTCQSTIGEVEPVTAMTCLSCRSYLRRQTDIVTGAPGGWVVIR
jgi:hypothetical protein